MRKVRLPDGPARVSLRRVKAGTILIADGGHNCIPRGASRMVFIDHSSEGGLAGVPQHSRERLYVRCAKGSKRHYLVGQMSQDRKSYVGFWLSPRQRY